MTDSDGWLERYGETHGNLTYPVLYWAAVPMVVTGTVGLLWSLPVPAQFFEISPLLNWGSRCILTRTRPAGSSPAALSACGSVIATNPACAPF